MGLIQQLVLGVEHPAEWPNRRHAAVHPKSWAAQLDERKSACTHTQVIQNQSYKPDGPNWLWWHSCRHVFPNSRHRRLPLRPGTRSDRWTINMSGKREMGKWGAK
jgi:hypothetical protein